MELEKEHRIALLNELVKAKQDHEILRSCLNEDSAKDSKAHFEISMFLAHQRIILIEDSLINNEIDF